MSVSERELLAGALVRHYGAYVGSKAYWRDRRRHGRRMREACLMCIRSDLKEFRESVINALRLMEKDVLPSRALAEALHWLRQRIGFARQDMRDNEWGAAMDGVWCAREQCRYEYAITVAECLVEVVPLDIS